MKRAMVIAATLFLMAGSGLGQIMPTQLEKYSMEPTVQGKAVSIEAEAAVGLLNRDFCLIVQVKANMEDGELIRVNVETTEGQLIQVGQISLVNGFGELRRVQRLVALDEVKPQSQCNVLSIPLDEIRGLRLSNHHGELAKCTM
jgi:hypothetical protein